MLLGSPEPPQGLLGFTLPRGGTCKGPGQTPTTTSLGEGCRRHDPAEALPACAKGTGAKSLQAAGPPSSRRCWNWRVSAQYGRFVSCFCSPPRPYNTTKEKAANEAPVSTSASAERKANWSELERWIGGAACPPRDHARKRECRCTPPQPKQRWSCNPSPRVPRLQRDRRPGPTSSRYFGRSKCENARNDVSLRAACVHASPTPGVLCAIRRQ